ncbi:MAG: hypothetical protein PHY47_23640 [Lachnospiraceae bacterium]|nr:hypothetical protein [Lachnospiraceae bacterium]
MNQEIINTIMYQMNLHLDNQQLTKLKQVLEQVMIDTTLHYAMVKQSNVRMHIENTLGR